MTRVWAFSISLASAGTAVVALVPACTTSATKEASVPCAADNECREGFQCLPTRNGVSGGCLQPVCSRKCTTDADCKGIRFDSAGKDCFKCQDVSECPRPGSGNGDAGATVHVCVDRCEML